MDLFDFFRFILCVVITIYCLLVTGQSLVGWYQWLNQPGQQIQIIRRYVVISLLRLRIVDFWADAVVTLLLLVSFLMLWHAHSLVSQVAGTLADARRQLQPLHWRAR